MFYFYVFARFYLTISLHSQDFQFFPAELTVLQERELAVHKRLNGIAAMIREPTTGPSGSADGTPDAETKEARDAREAQMNLLEEERRKEQEFIDTAEPLTEEEMTQKEAYLEQGFPSWSRRDFQQFVKGLEAYGWYVGFSFFIN